MTMIQSTQTGRPFYSPPLGVLASAALLIQWYNARCVTSTGANYAVPVLPIGTQAQPFGTIPASGGDPHAVTVYELRRLTALTWEDLGDLLGVSRQAVHDWANGKPIKPGNAEKLRVLVAAFRALPLTDAAGRRAALLSRLSDGRRPLDLLQDGAISDALAAIANYQQHGAPLLPRSHERPHPSALMDRAVDRPIPVTGAPTGKRSRRVRVLGP